MNLLRALAASFSYFSILPIPHSDEAPSSDAIALLPIVGLVIGGLAGLGAYGIWLVTHDALAAAIVAWVLSIALSGAIHVDGFLDCCDGLFAMVPPERRLQVMRDPHHGTYAIVGMAMLTVLWLYALLQIPAAMLPLALAATGFFGRWESALLRGSRVLAAILGVLFVVAFVARNPTYIAATLIAVAVAGLVTIIVLLFARYRLGGVVSGDCYGAAIVVTELALLLAYPFLTSLR